MLAIVAALPREIAGLVKGTQADASLRLGGIHLYRLPAAIVVAGGMGDDRATAAVAAALGQNRGEVETLISVGLAGACRVSLSPGTVAEADAVVDARTGERFFADATGRGEEPVVLVTSPSIAGVREKARLAETYSASMVDMEAATVARLARANGLKFRAIKAVSDAHDFELASLARFTGRHGSFRTGKFALHTAFRPHTWSKSMVLGRHSARALVALESELRSLLVASP